MLGLIAVASLWAGSMGANAQSASLYSGPGSRPGPDILYAPPAAAPQLSNTGIWHAAPILISGASAYRDGEYLYQDYIYDDHGANGQLSDPGDPRRAPGNNPAEGDAFSRPNGTYTYPTSPVYANNAADLVELRIKPLAHATAFRITLNTLKDPTLVGTSIAIGNSALPAAFTHGANAHAPAQMFLTVHGSSADLLDGVTGQTVGSTAPSVSVDLSRRQIQVVVPHSDWAPSGVVRFAAGVGLWDNVNNRYLLPQFAADATHPGGAGLLAAPPAFFNVAFRHTEPMPSVSDVNTAANPAWWRDRDQGTALAAGDLGSLHDDVDFTKLSSGATDNSGVPTTGPIDRIFASHFESQQGADYSVACGVTQACAGELRGQLQPYAIYVPHQARPSSGYGLTLLLHSLNGNYNQYLGSRNQSQFGDRGTGSIVITAEGRGPDGWYYDKAGADVFEMWADTAAHYHLNPDWTAIAGYSMGGYGTYKLASQFPDLFAKAQPTVGPPALGIWVPPTDPVPGGQSSNTYNQLDSLRNVPFRIWVMATDELVPVAGTTQQSRGFDALGYRYEFDVFAPGDHLTLAINDQYQPAADFLGTTRVDRNPAHVTYVVNPTMDFPADGTTADHAYWLSGLRLRDGTGSAPRGRIDVRSEGFGVADPTPSGTVPGAGVLSGGNLPGLAFVSTAQTWGAAPPAPVADKLDIKASNVSQVVVDVRRAHVDCDVVLNVVSDGPLTVHLAGCSRVVALSAATQLAGGTEQLFDTNGAGVVTSWPLLTLPLVALHRIRRRAQRTRGSATSVSMP